MKRFFILVFFITVSELLFSQVRIDSLGRTTFYNSCAIGTAPSPSVQLGVHNEHLRNGVNYGIFSNLLIPNPIAASGVAICGNANSESVTQNVGIRIVGVLGQASQSSYIPNQFSAGVVGVSCYHSGVGVYGSIAYSPWSIPTTWNAGTYAGYFSGPVKVLGTLSVPSISTTSDARLKDNISSLDDDAIDIIMDLDPVSFTYIEDSTQFIYVSDSAESNQTHYGLIAQDVLDVIPSIVQQNQDGYYTVNYLELIPFLIKSLQEQHATINALENRVDSLSSLLMVNDNRMYKKNGNYVTSIDGRMYKPIKD